MADSFVRLDQATRRFQLGGTTVNAVSDVSCTIGPGDRIAILGPSGSGKSTLLSLMAGLDEPSSGQVSWPALGPRRDIRPRHIGMAFQTQSLLPALSVVENVEVPLLILGETADARARAMDMLKRIELDFLGDRLPEELSGGQMQRVAMARALVARPRLILADEPTGQLDQATGQRLIDAILANIEGSDAALVIATHDHAMARRMKANWYMNYGVLETGRRLQAVS